MYVAVVGIGNQSKKYTIGDVCARSICIIYILEGYAAGQWREKKRTPLMTGVNNNKKKNEKKNYYLDLEERTQCRGFLDS